MSRGIEKIGMAGSIDLEWNVRSELAALYRAAALLGWDDLIFSHISARVPEAYNEFLILEYGLLFEEVSASNLVKVGLDGSAIGPGIFELNPAGFAIHSAVYKARSDINFIMHLHTLDCVAVASQCDGLLPISQQALLVWKDVAYHDYAGIVDDEEEQARLVRDLGEKAILILNNHGVLLVGNSASELFLNAYYLEAACRAQTVAKGVQLKILPDEVVQRVVAQRAKLNSAGPSKGTEKAWDAMCRKLDKLDASYRR